MGARPPKRGPTNDQGVGMKARILAASAAIAMAMSIVPAGAAEPCAHSLCATPTDDQGTACRSVGLFPLLAGLQFTDSKSNSVSGPSKHHGVLVNADYGTVSAQVIETYCESQHTGDLNLGSCGWGRIVGLEVDAGAVHIRADELRAEVCAGVGEAPIAMRTVVVGLDVIEPGVVAIADPIAPNTHVPLGVADLYLNEQREGHHACVSRNANALRLETPGGTLIAGFASAVACPTPQ